MSSRSYRSWGWIPAEIAILVTGILMAFGLNSFWESRSAAAREQAHLHALSADFSENVARLEHIAEQRGRTSVASRELLLIARGHRIAPADSVDRLFGQVFNWSRFDAVMGAYEGLVNSGGLAQIRDDTLRGALATFASALDSRYVEEFSAAAYHNLTRDFVGRLGWPELVLRDALGGDDGEADTSAGAWNHDVLADPDFQGHLALRSVAEAQVAQFYQALGERARAVLDRIGTLIH